ncbi:uncharacterized protein [Diabrotica undecimpunctata]|uniref:uncharacterized protein n=1 Tax=Diabrotica undecimpunctata TaxID=50387 RepID=UPI003B635C20
MKQKRTTGTDEIPNELIKNGGKKLLTSIYNLIVRIYEAEEMPEDWKEALIKQKLTQFTEKKIGDYQQGFREVRSTTDAIIVTQTIEKCHEHNIELHILFVDFRQAFDCIGRNKLFIEMKNQDIPEKLIRLTKMTMDGARAKVTTEEGSTKSIAIETGVKCSRMSSSRMNSQGQQN